MLTRVHGRIVFECDGCADTLETDTRCLHEARAILRRDGWRAVQVGDDWNHYCNTACLAAAGLGD
jgi:hypothetical protein